MLTPVDTISAFLFEFARFAHLAEWRLEGGQYLRAQYGEGHHCPLSFVACCRGFKPAERRFVCNVHSFDGAVFLGLSRSDGDRIAGAADAIKWEPELRATLIRLSRAPKPALLLLGAA